MAEEGGPFPMTFDGATMMVLIKNVNTNYEGFLAEQVKDGKLTGKVVRSPSDPWQCVCTVYFYDNGGFAVLQFEESTNYVFAKTTKELRLLKAKYWKTKAEDIKTTADPRVFFIKRPDNSNCNVVFASCVASQQAWDPRQVITFFQDPQKPAALLTEGTGTGTGEPQQQFCVFSYALSDHPLGEDDSQGWKPVELPLQPDIDKDSDKGQD